MDSILRESPIDANCRWAATPFLTSTYFQRLGSFGTPVFEPFFLFQTNTFGVIFIVRLGDARVSKLGRVRASKDEMKNIRGMKFRSIESGSRPGPNMLGLTKRNDSVLPFVRWAEDQRHCELPKSKRGKSAKFQLIVYTMFGVIIPKKRKIPFSARENVHRLRESIHAWRSWLRS